MPKKFTDPAEIRPWAALWTLVLGFFMILVDTTIVSVANPTIMKSLNTDMTATLWATSAYLLAYAVPLLITGRLGDRFGPRRVYLIGLTVFALSSLACGLSPTIEMLVVARVFQGFGAALMTPQTMAVITRIFAPRERGQAMAVWGITAGVATLVGPILGGFLIDAVGWEWIFFINVPVAIVGFVLALKYVPRLETHAHRLDWLGVVLSAVGMFLVVFGIQEGENFNWGQIWGPISVWLLIGVGLVVLGLFVWWQHVQRGEPLLPLRIFRDRNFSVGTSAIVTVGFAVTSMSMPLMFFFQLVRGLTPTQSALMLVPMAVISAGMARPIGILIDRGGSPPDRNRWVAAPRSWHAPLLRPAAARYSDLAAAHPERGAWRRKRLHVGSAVSNHDVQPPNGPRRRGFWRVQHEPPGGCRARLRVHHGADGIAPCRRARRR